MSKFMLLAVVELAKALKAAPPNAELPAKECIQMAADLLGVHISNIPMKEAIRKLGPLSVEDQEAELIAELLQQIEKARGDIQRNRMSMRASHLIIRMAMNRLNKAKALLKDLDYKGSV